MEAARRNDRRRVRALIEAGAKGTAKQLMDAARAAETNVVAALIESGAKGTRSQLETAARMRELAVVTALIQSGAKGTRPQTLEAASRNEPAVVDALARSGVDLDAVLFEAALHGEAEAIPVLIECGADPNAPDRNGSVPLYAAAALRGRRRVKVDAIRRLREAGADPDDSGNGFEPILHSVAKSVGWGYAPSPVEHIGVLLEAGADPDARDHNGTTALHAVVSAYVHDRAEERDPAPYAAAIAALLAGGASPNARDSFGRTPLECATGNPRRADPAVLAALGKSAADRLRAPYRATRRR
ncbi:MAG: ankyrin repeat domain-containing protein [Gammaproteobacteria bacterium]|nr:ankyrin repeat domain-containing protein [Gammaproteobacteria bacterium]